MKIKIVGDGSFGTFLNELLAPHFDIDESAESVILAVPISAYETVAAEHRACHLINVCSVQKPSTDHILKYTTSVTSVHPLFGAYTPPDKRNSIVTRTIANAEGSDRFADSEREFLDGFSKVTRLIYVDQNGEPFTPDSHDQLMAKTHVAAVLGAKQLKVFVDRAESVPDELVPNSFRLMRDFVKTLEDTPQGTIESIMANPYF